ncbi:hypothetical protein KHA93_03445 [Bacillus sp. FJAT-49732]|uniref:Uncharacterized protein n=1 Tax=Lederbergia citrisecunda TaxID=2833583 RepID=A0A942TIK6_9BACI|nr:hypothetical protein [Lederbergia citrisecunda]MBS4198705.1 hypothetical protein [Lederbergia citrisecunda]
MGYIAPIHNYQYTQYHERLRAKANKIEPYPINKVQKVNLTPDNNYNGIEKKFTYSIEKVTGKGRHFSEYV